MLLVAVIPALIAFHVCKRSRKVASITFGVFVALGLAGQVHLATKQQRDARNLAQADATLREEQAALRADLQSGNVGPSRNIERADRVGAALDKVAQSLSGDEARFVQANRAVLGRFQAPMVGYAQAQKRMANLSPLNAPPQSRAQLKELRDAADECARENEKARAVYARIGSIVEEESKRQGLSATGQAQLARLYDFTEVGPIIEQIRDQDKEIVASLKQVADLLDINWGQWEFNRDRKMYVFRDQTTLATFRRLVDRMDALAREQRASQQKVAQLEQARRASSGQGRE